ncbi:3430_t:CDS:1, partial [Entrophospora sp. SA101]
NSKVFRIQKSLQKLSSFIDSQIVKGNLKLLFLEYLEICASI